jgi:CheY-like chemotaxis protein
MPMPTKILVIDDDSAVTDLLSLLLKSQGFDVTATNNSTEGLNLVRENQPDLVVLDLMMPEIDGWKYASCVRSVMCQLSYFQLSMIPR